MAERKNGLAPLPSGLFRATAAAPAPPPQADGPADDQGDEGRGEAPGPPAADPRTPKPRRKRVLAGGETKGRKLSLPDGACDRLQLLALKRRTTASAVAAEILDRNLPRLRIEQD